jgi:hypothetical protein
MIGFLEVFTDLQLVLLFITVGYGIVFGIGNTCHRVICMFSIKVLHQSTVGGLLDGLFYAIVAYLTYVYFGG